MCDQVLLELRHVGHIVLKRLIKNLRYVKHASWHRHEVPDRDHLFPRYRLLLLVNGCPKVLVTDVTGLLLRLYALGRVKLQLKVERVCTAALKGIDGVDPLIRVALAPKVLHAEL